MATRFGILIGLLALAITFQILHYCALAIMSYALCVLLVLEAIMCSLFLYSSLSLSLGRAKDARSIRVSYPSSYEVLCVPLSLRFPWWEIRDIRLVTRSSDISTDSSLYDLSGYSSESDLYTLDWRNSKGWIAIAYRDGNTVAIGTPLSHQYPGRKQNYPITVEVWHSGKLLVCSSYILDTKMCLSDDSRHNLVKGESNGKR